MLTTNQRMGMDQKRLRPQGRQMQQQAKDIQPQRAAQANPPQGVQQAPRVPATKGARTTPVFQAGKPMQAKPTAQTAPPPSQVPSQQAAPQGLAPGAQGGQQGGGLSQQNNVGGIQFNPGGMSTQPPPSGGGVPVEGNRDITDELTGYMTGRGGLAGKGDIYSLLDGSGGQAIAPPVPKDELPPVVYDDRTYQQMLQDYMMEQLMNGGPDTAAQEALIMQAMEAQVGQGVADVRANMGGGGFAVGGALGALEGDIRREGAMGANQQIMDMKGQEQDRWMDEIMGVTGALQSERELGIYETAFERALRMLEEDGDNGPPGGGGGDGYNLQDEDGNTTVESVNNAGLEAQQDANQAAHVAAGMPSDATFTNDPPDAAEVYGAQLVNGYTVWTGADGKKYAIRGDFTK